MKERSNFFWTVKLPSGSGNYYWTPKERKTQSEIRELCNWADKAKLDWKVKFRNETMWCIGGKQGGSNPDCPNK